MPVTTIRLGGRPDQPVLLLGPAVGTSVQALWSEAARLLAEHFQVVGWDLPGHGSNSRFARRPDGSFPPVSLSSLTRDLIEALDRLLDTAPGASPTPIHYAGQGLGGLVGLDLALERPRQVASLTLLGRCLPDVRRDAAELSPLPHISVHESRPDAVEALQAAAMRIGSEALEAARHAHGDADLDDRLAQLTTPVLAVVGDGDALDASWIREAFGRAGIESLHIEELPGAGQMPPVEAPEKVAALIHELVLGPVPAPRNPTATATTAASGSATSRALDATTEALVRLALTAGQRGSTGENGVRIVLDAARRAARAGAAPDAVAATLRLAWGDRDADGRLAEKVRRMIQASRC